MQHIYNLFFGNYILSVAILSWLVAQISKALIHYLLSGEFVAERLWGAGDIPSSHSALVCSMLVATAKLEGLNSPMFAFAFLLAAIVMYDAMGVRHETGEQAKLLNKMMDEWLVDNTNLLTEKSKRLKEKVGHTPLEVLSGALLGILIAVLVPVMR